MGKILRITLGGVALVLGLAGMVLPVLQGWFFLALGVLILSVDFPVFARLLCRLQRRFPRLERLLTRWEAQLRRIGITPPHCRPPQ